MDEKIIGNFIIQIAGKPVEEVDKALKLVLTEIKENEDMKVLEFEIIEPELEEETTLYSGLIELKIKFEDINSILEFILDYTPNSVEIESPEKIIMKSHNLTGILNNLSHILLDNNKKIYSLNAHIHHLTNSNQKK